MEELEDPTEKLKEIQEAAEEMFEKKERWTLHVALTTGVIAVFAAIAGLIGSHHANEAVLEQIRSSDQWSYYQSKSIKSELAGSTAKLLVAMGKSADSSLENKLKGYEADKKDIKEKAEGFEQSAESHMRQHLVFAKSVTIFQIAIAIAAIAILTRRKPIWYFCLLLSAAGCTFLVMGFLTQ